jgi:hypothetical protein
MIGRIIPYSEIFVSLTLSLDEAAALADLLGGLKPHKDSGTQKTAVDLREALEENLERAAAYKARRST